MLILIDFSIKKLTIFHKFKHCKPLIRLKSEHSDLISAYLESQKSLSTITFAFPEIEVIPKAKEKNLEF